MKTSNAPLPTPVVISLITFGVLYGIALGCFTAGFAGYDFTAAISTAALIVAGLAVATPVVVRKSRAAGRLPEAAAGRHSIFGVIGMMLLGMGLCLASMQSVTLAVSLGAVAVFGFMAAFILVLVYAKIEIATRNSLTSAEQTPA